jgi:hypothetical protein
MFLQKFVFGVSTQWDLQAQNQQRLQLNCSSVPDCLMLNFNTFGCAFLYLFMLLVAATIDEQLLMYQRPVF